MRLARASVPVLLLVLFGLLAHTYAGKSAIKASAFVTTYSELNEQEEIKLLAQVTEAFFKQGWVQTPQNYIAQIANQANISGYKLETSELPGLADKLAALINKVRTESVPLEGNASAQSPPSYPATNTNTTGSPTPVIAPSQNSSLPFDPTKVLGYPVNATDAGSIYDSITRNAKVQCGKSPLPIRCGIVKTVQDVETFRNQPVPPPPALLDQIHKFMNQDFEEAEKIIQEKMSKDLQDHESNHEGRVKNVTARIQEAQNVLQQIKDEALNLVVDQKKRVASLQKDIDDQKYFLEELNKILKKPPTPAANPIPLTQIVSQPTAIPTSSGATAPIYAATVVKQAGSQLGRVQSESLNEDTADPVALTSAPVIQKVTAVPTSATSVQYQTTQAPVLLNTAPTQTTVTQAGSQVTVQVTKSPDNKVQEPSKSTTTTASNNQTTSQSEPVKDTTSSPNIFVRFWRWLTGKSSSSSTTNNGSGISGHVVLNKRADN